MQDPKIVWVKWLDSAARHDWSESESQPSRISTIGFLVNETDEYVSVSNAVDEQFGLWNDILTIPKCAILEWGDLEVN